MQLERFIVDDACAVRRDGRPLVDALTAAAQSGPAALRVSLDRLVIARPESRALLLLLLSSGCGRISYGADPRDAGRADAAFDAGVEDGGVDGSTAADTGLPDASPLDAPDAALPDAGADGGAPPVGWTFIDSAETATCGMRTGGQLYCWGRYVLGVPGAGMGTIAPLPVPVASPTGFSGAWESLSTSDNHACAIDDAGRAYCWANDAAGELGDGLPMTFSDTPVRVADPVGFSGRWSRIAVGDFFTCGIDSAGRAYCWGRGDYGILGDGVTTGNDRPFPAPVVEPAGFSGVWTDIRTGHVHTCAVDDAGSAFCWGYMIDWTPTRIPDPASGVWSAVHAGVYYQCGISTTGDLYCWGDEFSGCLGDGPGDAPRASPVHITPGVRYREIALDGESFHACAVTETDELHCWGMNNFGEVPGSGDQHVPTLLLSGVRHAGIGEYITCAVMTDGSARCVGYGSPGALGDGMATDSATPVRVADPT